MLAVYLPASVVAWVSRQAVAALATKGIGKGLSLLRKRGWGKRSKRSIKTLKQRKEAYGV